MKNTNKANFLSEIKKKTNNSKIKFINYCSKVKIFLLSNKSIQVKFKLMINYLKNPKILLALASIIILIPISIYYIKVSSYGITFNESKTNIQYGEEFSYDDVILEVTPEGANVIYPDIEIKEVGVYDLSFTYIHHNKEKEVKQVIRVVDTIGPQFELKLEESVPIEIRINTAFNPFSTISDVKNMPSFDVAAYPSFELLTEDEYLKRINELDEAHNKINNRIIKTGTEIEEIKTANNTYFYKTNLDNTTVGTYSTDICAVDSNYNYVTLTKEITVVEANQYLNIGGSVVCDYDEAILEDDAYHLDYKETYNYDEHKLLQSAHFNSLMTFNNEFNTVANIQTLYNASFDKFNSYNVIAGVGATVNTTDNGVTIDVYIDFKVYDKTNDPLSIVKTEGKGEIDIASIIQTITNATCTIY